MDHFDEDEEPYLNKSIEDYDMIEAICGNDQACGRFAVQFGNRIGTQMEDDTAPEDIPPTENFTDMLFGEGNAFGDASPLNHSQTNISEPTTSSSPTQRRKGKGKRKSNGNDDTTRELAITIRDAFESVRSSRSLSFAKELQDECIKVTQYGYSTEQAMRLYRFLMKDDSEARTFFAMCDDFRKIWLNEFFT